MNEYQGFPALEDLYNSIEELKMYAFHKGDNPDHCEIHNAIITLLLKTPKEYLIDEVFILRNQLQSIINKHNLNLND